MRHDAYSPRVPWQILFHQEVVGWIHQLNPKEKLSVDLAVEALREKGPVLGRPLVDVVKDSGFKNMKELRPLGTTLRCLFAFDQLRRAIVLVAGDKHGMWRNWYQENVPLADSRFKEHLTSMHRDLS